LRTTGRIKLPRSYHCHCTEKRMYRQRPPYGSCCSRHQASAYFEHRDTVLEYRYVCLTLLSDPGSHVANRKLMTLTHDALLLSYSRLRCSALLGAARPSRLRSSSCNPNLAAVRRQSHARNPTIPRISNPWVAIRGSTRVRSRSLQQLRRGYSGPLAC